MQVKCNIITPAISSLAKEIGKSDAYTCNLVSAWQTEMYKGNIIPTKSQMLDYIKKNQATVKELEFAIPCYNYEQENGQSKLVRHNGKQKFLNKLYDNFEATKGTVTNLNEAYRFLLWREQSIIQNGYYDDYRDSAKATNDALTKLRLWKQAQTSGPKENKELPTKNDTINIYAGANENADLSNFANTRVSQARALADILNAQSSDNLSTETDSSNDSMPEIGTGAEQLLKVDTDTPMAKLAMDINPIQRRARVDMLAHQFSEKLDELVQQKVDELKAELNQEMLGERRPNVLNRIKKQAQLYDNAFEGRKAIMSTAGTSAKEIFDMIKSDLEEAVKDTDSYTPEEIKAYQKVIDNFDLLVNETCAKLESTENVRITFSQNNYHNGDSVSKVVSSNIEDTAQKEEDDEEALNDDDTGKRVEGNAGWSYHARFVDPRTSISKTTKHIIANIPMLDENGEYMVDDLGYQRYMDENYAHNVLHFTRGFCNY